MKTLYFNTKAEVTAFAATQRGETYRTRMNCGCSAGYNRRDGILIVMGEQVTYKLIRCRGCRKEAAV